MHKLIEYICDELDELERKADKDGKLSMAEVQYMDTLAHAKKNLLKSEEMMGEDEYSMASGRQSRRGMRDGISYRYEGEGSYARGRGRNARRDSMGRYSREGYSMANDEMLYELREMMNEVPDEQTKIEFQRFIKKMESM